MTITAAVRKGQLEQAAGAAGVDVDDVVLQQAIDGRLDGGERGLRAVVVLGVGKVVREPQVMLDKIDECDSAIRV